MKIDHVKSTTTFFFLLLALSVFAQSGIYVGGHFRRDRTVTVPTLKASGFTYVILFNIKVEPNGDLTTDGETICSNGVYVFGNTQPHYVEDVKALRQGMTSVRRVESCIGGWLSPSYSNIKTLVNTQGTGSTSILYKNFKALKDTLPIIEAINNDDEATYDVATATSFHVMLYDLGFKTTLAPYTNKSFWQSLATNVNTQRPGAVDRIDLQCYDGGAGNNPNNWNINNIKMHGGMTHFNSSATITSQMSTWKNNSAIVGGFLWVYNANDFNLKTYAAAITSVFGGGDVANVDKMKPHVTVYSEKNFSGKIVNFEAGKHTKAGIVAQEFPDLSLKAIKLSPGFKIELYSTTDCTGEFFTVTNNVSDLNAVHTASVNSWIVRPMGDATFASKKIFLRNRKSGLYMTLASDSYDVGITVQQKAFVGTNNQKWLFAHLGDGVYRIKNMFSNKSIQVKDAADTDNALFTQDVYAGLLSHKFMLIESESAGFYKLIPLNSLKYVGIANEAVNSNLIQSSTVSQETDWELIDESAAGLGSVPETEIRIYPNPVSDQLYIDNDLDIERIIIVDINGRKLLIQNGRTNSINVSGLSKGIYFMNIYIEGRIIPTVLKFVRS